MFTSCAWLGTVLVKQPCNTCFACSKKHIRSKPEHCCPICLLFEWSTAQNHFQFLKACRPFANYACNAFALALELPQINPRDNVMSLSYPPLATQSRTTQQDLINSIHGPHLVRSSAQDASFPHLTCPICKKSKFSHCFTGHLLIFRRKNSIF